MIKSYGAGERGYGHEGFQVIYRGYSYVEIDL